MRLDLIANSLLVGVGTTLLAGILGLIAALWAAALEANSRKIICLLAIVSFAIPPFLQVNCWLDLVGASGSIRAWVPFNIYSKLGAVCLLALLTWPIFFGFGLSAWSRIEAAQIESDIALRGVNLIRWLLWPMARVSTAQGGLLVFALALSNFAIPALLQVRVLPAQVWVQFETKLDSIAALLTSLPLLLAPILLLFFWRNEELSFRGESRLAPRALRRQLGTMFSICGIITLTLLALSVALPAWQLMSAPRTWNDLIKVTFAVSDVLQNSFVLSASASLLCLAIGILISRWRVGSFLWLPLFLPGVLIGIALVSAFNRGAFDIFYRSLGIIILAWTLRYVALSWHSARTAFHSIDPQLIDFARTSGARGWNLFRHVQWPHSAPRLALAWYVTYLLCLWDIETIILILPPGGETLAVRIFGLLHYGHNTQVNALCLLLLTLAVTPLIVWQLGRWVMTSSLMTTSLQRVSLTLFVMCAFLATGCAKKESSDSLAKSHFFRAVEIIGRRGAGAGEFNKPRSLALDRNDNLYVVDMTGRVQKFAPDGRFLLSWQMPETDLGKPKGMAMDAQGNIIVVEPHYQRVNHFSSEGKLVAQWGKSGTNRGELTLPRSVAVNSRGEIFVSEYTRVDRVQSFSPPSPLNGERAEVRGEIAPATPILLLGQPGSDPGEFNRAEGLGIDSQDRLYVADSCNHRIQVFSRDGKWLRTHGQPGKNPGEMSYPYDIRIDTSGNQYVCEFGNSRIQIFDSHDQLVEIVGRPGADPGQFSNPWSIALDSRGNLYVADAGNHRVQKLIRK